MIRKLVVVRPSLLLCCYIHNSVLCFLQVNLLTKKLLRKERIELQINSKEEQTLIVLNQSLILTMTDPSTLKFYSTSTLRVVFEIDLLLFATTEKLSYASCNGQVLVWSPDKLVFWELNRGHPAASVNFPKSVGESFSEIPDQGKVLLQTQDGMQIFVVNSTRRELEQILNLNLPRMVSGSHFNGYVFFTESIEFFGTKVWNLSCYRFTKRLEPVFQEIIGDSEVSITINVLKNENAILASDAAKTILIKKELTKVAEVQVLNKIYPQSICAVVEIADGNLVIVLDAKCQIWLWISPRNK